MKALSTLSKSSMVWALTLPAARLGVEAPAQGNGCRDLGCADGAQLGVETVGEQRLERGAAGGVVILGVGEQRHLPDRALERVLGGVA